MTENILGINFSTDSAAVLLSDGKIAAAACQERFDRLKHSWGFPSDAIDYCLKSRGISLHDVDVVAFSWNPAHHLAVPNRLRETIYRNHREYLDIVPARLMSMMNSVEAGQESSASFDIADGNQLKVRYFDHHLCHAAGAFYASGFESAAILTADGYGENKSTLLGSGGPAGIRVIDTVPSPHSLGSVYAAVTSFLGFMPNCDEGKVMALAAFGNPSRFEDEFQKVIFATGDSFEVGLDYFRYYMPSGHRYSEKFVKTFGQPRKPGSGFTQEHYDVAAALQQSTNNILLHLANRLHDASGEHRLCLAGGVALNSVAMGVLERESPFDEIFVLPAAHDGGGGLGAALLASGANPKLDAYSDFLGPGIDVDRAAGVLSDYGVRFERVNDGSLAAAELLAKGQVVGFISGRMEFGPRALGARSIFADPRDPKSKEIVNLKVKRREAFRPFAPVALEGAVKEYLENPKPTPFMNKVYQAKPGAIDKIPAVVHHDGSVRLQTVTADQHPPVHRLVSHFESLTGIPMVLNTSLNKQGQPICATIEDALSCFFTSGMDALVIEDFLVRK